MKFPSHEKENKMIGEMATWRDIQIAIRRLAMEQRQSSARKEGQNIPLAEGKENV